MKYTTGGGKETSLWFDHWHPHSSFTDFYGEGFIYYSGIGKNTMVNVLVSNLEWRIPTTQANGWYPIIDAIPSNFNPKIRKRDKILWLDSSNQRFPVKVAWEQLRICNQMVVQQKLTTQDKLHRFGLHGPNWCSLCLLKN